MSGWLASTMKCRVCSHRHISVYPENIFEEDNQECPKCHARAAEVTGRILNDGSVEEVET